MIQYLAARPSGEIVKIGGCGPNDLPFQAVAGATIHAISWVVPPRGAAQYWNGSGIADRPVVLALPVTLELDIGETYAAAVGNDVAIFVDGVSAGLWDGEIAFAAAGDYTLRFEPPFPAQAQAVAVSVV